MYCTVCCNLQHIHEWKLITFFSVSYHLIPSFTYQTKTILVFIPYWQLAHQANATLFVLFYFFSSCNTWCTWKLNMTKHCEPTEHNNFLSLTVVTCIDLLLISIALLFCSPLFSSTNSCVDDLMDEDEKDRAKR